MQKRIDFNTLPESDVVINYMIHRFRKGLYTLVLATGLPGSGKSSTCMRLGELFYQNLDLKKEVKPKDIVDSLRGLLGRLREVESPGEVIIIEELSVLFPSRRAMARANVAIARVLDTCRKKGVILISNAPLFNSIDSHIRALGNILIETLKILKKEEVVISKAFRLQTNPRNSKTYLHRFKRDGREVHRIYTRKPNNALWNLYEKQKDKFIDDLYEELEAQAIKENKKNGKEERPSPVSSLASLTEKELKLYTIMMREDKKLSDIANEEGVNVSLISRRWSNIKKKLGIGGENRGLIANNSPSAIVN